MQLDGMSQTHAESLKKWFLDYVQQFDLGRNDWQRNITLKIDHSKRVAVEARNIAQSLRMGEDALRRVEMAP